MRSNRNDLDYAGRFTKKNRERKVRQAEPAQCRRPRDGESVWRLTDIRKGGRDFSNVACTQSWLLCLVVSDLLQVLALGLRKKRYPHLSKACALR